MRLKICVFICFVLSLALAFDAGDSVTISVNRISPFSNPTEAYRYYELPFCRPEDPVEQSQTLGEKLSGNRKMSSLYASQFLTSTKRFEICKKTLNENEVKEFKKAIEQNYLFEMFIEDIAAGNYIGYTAYDDEKEETRVYLYTHLLFKIWYDSKTAEIVAAEIETSDVDAVDVTEPANVKEVSFYYSVKYMASHSGNVIRHNKGNDTYFAEEFHWMSLVNAFMLTSTLLIIAYVIISRIVKSDFNNDLEIDRSAEDAKWKMIRIEVFKCPEYRNLLCAGVGSGVQLVLMVLLIFLLGALGIYYSHRGSLHTAGVLLYSATAIISGLVSARIYKYLGGKHWAFNIISTACLFPVQLFVAVFILNNIAWASRLTSALPFTSILFVIFMWALVTLPLTVFGGITGRMKTDESLVDVDEKLPKISKKVPELPLYQQPLVTVLLSGLLPFSVVYLELYYLFSSIWGHKIYTMWGMIFIIFVLMMNVTACISMILTYFQLNSLDYRWWWRSFFYGGSAALYIFLYGIYFFYQQSAMFGFIQGVFFFGYTIVICAAIFLMLGSVSFLSSLAFVKYIYERSKID